MNYGVDPDGPLPDIDDNDIDMVVVPPIPCPLNPDHYDDLVLAVDLLSSSDNYYGIDVYLQVFRFVQGV